MKNKIIITLVLFVALVSLDQYVKSVFVQGWEWHSEVFSLVLTYNYGVAFSMFAFLAENLKYIQIAILSSAIIYLFFNKDIFEHYYIPISMLFAGGISNIADRFIHGGVVDYFYWHYWFDFAIFNLADVIIDMAVALILFEQYRIYKKEKALKEK
mgnify:CR=1 FL=1